jgi:plasmid stability protein
MTMATLTVRNLDDDVVRRLRIRAAEHGRSAEAEHRDILRAVLMADGEQLQQRQKTAALLAEFRRRTATRGSQSASELLTEARTARIETLTPPDDGA